VVSNRNNIEDLYYCVCRIVEINTRHNTSLAAAIIQGGSNMTGTNLYVNKCKQSRSYLNHLVHLQHTFPVEALLSIKNNSQQMLRMSSTSINARMDTYGISHLLNVPGRWRMVWQASRCVGEMS